MTSLTRIAVIARKTIRYGIFLVIFLIIGKIALNMGINAYKKAFPAPPPPPTVKYGKLTKIPFPEASSSAKFTYTLETPEGGLPNNISAQAKVFFMPKVSPNLLSLDAAKNTADGLGFSANPQQISNTIYIFNNLKVPNALKMNIITQNFSISYNLAQDKSPLNNRPPIAEVAAARLRSVFSATGILASDLNGPTTNEYLKLSNGQFVTAISLSEANATKVNLFREDYDKLPSVTGTPDQANVWAILTGDGDANKQIVAAEYHYFPVDSTQYATYPIKTPAEAFSELQGKQAFIAAVGLNNDGDNIKIRRVHLAYFDPESPTEFYQPIYVFEGDNGFIAYLSAVTSVYYGQ